MRWVALAALSAGGFAVTTPPRPPFPGPVAGAPAATHLRILSSIYRAPALDSGWTAYRPVPKAFRGAPLLRPLTQSRTVLALYGKDGARYLLAFDRAGRYRYGFDFRHYVQPPRAAPGERDLVSEEVQTAREADGTLYVENAHLTYAESSYDRNAYVTAFDLKTKRRLWRSPALVANARSFVVTPRYLVTGYGFTAEPDYLYLLDRRTGRIQERLKLPSAPERITRKGNRLTVRTYDHVLVVRLTSA